MILFYTAYINCLILMYCHPDTTSNRSASHRNSRFMCCLLQAPTLLSHRNSRFTCCLLQAPTTYLFVSKRKIILRAIGLEYSDHTCGSQTSIACSTHKKGRSCSPCHPRFPPFSSMVCVAHQPSSREEPHTSPPGPLRMAEAQKQALFIYVTS